MTTKDIVRMHEEENLTFQEIAEMLDLEEDEVVQMYNKAKNAEQ